MGEVCVLVYVYKISRKQFDWGWRGVWDWEVTWY